MHASVRRNRWLAGALRVPLVLLPAVAVALPGMAAAAPPTPQFGPAIDGYAIYDPQDTCDPTEKPGPQDLRALLNQTYGGRTGYITRVCSDGGTSEHKEGRALDYMLNVNSAGERAIADDVLNWMLATDQHGNRHAMARRWGIMYIIWNRQIWRAYDSGAGWQPYSGTNPHTDHIHFSFSWAGARRQTSWWTGRPPDIPVVGRTQLADLDGDGRDDLVGIYANGDVMVWRNTNGISGTTYSAASAVKVASGFGNPNATKFGDVDGDGRADLVGLHYSGEVRVWRNTNGLSGTTYSAANPPVVVAKGFTDADRTWLADIDGDGRDDLIGLYDPGDVMVWRNTNGITTTTYSAANPPVKVAAGFGDPFRNRFADLDGDKRDELIGVYANGDVMVWRNSNGVTTTTYSAANPAVKVATGFTDANRTKLGDLDGDGRDELVGLHSSGDVRVWRNTNGITTTTYSAANPPVVVAEGFTAP